MDEIKAFVGHSFLEHDGQLVGTFLKYFNQLQTSHPNFSWEHAEGAQPTDLADKVLSLMKGKNVFIGICTKKEQAVDFNSLSSVILRSAYKKAKESAFQWKTSDWIIQEIGLAIGRGLDLILLLEDGVREPGGLQGNLEYIRFERAAPERAFGKILEMLNSLSPKAPTSVAAPSPSPASELEESKKDSGHVDLVPKSEWRRVDFEIAITHSIIDGDAAATTRISDAYLNTEDAAKDDNAISWEAHNEWLRVTFGKNGNLQKLKEIASDNPRSQSAHEYLAMAVSRYGNYPEAALHYIAAANNASSLEEKFRLNGRSALEYAQANDRAAVARIIGDLRKEVESNKIAEMRFLGVLKELAEYEKDDHCLLATMERMVEILPEDVDTRFSLAYKHSDSGDNEVALHHYLQIPFYDRNRTTWNNLGVAFDHFKLPIKSVNAYRKSAENGETLAMSNLGYKFLSAGFLREAQDECNKGLSHEGYHKNIGLLLAQLKEQPDEESEKEKEILQKVEGKLDFYRLLGRGIWRAEPEISGRWKGPKCELVARISGRNVRMLGSYEDDNALFSLMNPGAQKQTTKYRVEYVGMQKGRTIHATVSTTLDGQVTPRTLLGIATDSQTKVVMVVSDDNNEIRVMENPGASNPTFYSLKKLFSE